MTTPSTDLSPFFEKAWPEGKNVGQETLQPHSPAEIVESTRPERSSSLTGGGGRTVFSIRKATTDSPNKLVITGPQLIPPGISGPVSTANDAFVRYGGTPTVGTIVGVPEGKDRMESGQHGWVVVGDVKDGICRVMRLGGGGGGGTVILGVLETDVNHLAVDRVKLIEQIGILTKGDIVELKWRDPEEWVEVVNVSYLVQRAGNTGAIIPTAEPLVEVRYRTYFDMPLVFPAQLEVCFQPNLQTSTTGADP